ncbi:hypothetical protein ACFWFU_23345 [Streptomyces sp. NPDC060235]|uniref:hypothetical protein n=1 Tax=Streptomyces sp. NPDC060235 TaxID=3347080 RepID=UPI00364F6FCE
MTASAVPSAPPPAPRRPRRVLRMILSHLVRGLAYGTGTAATGVLAYWIQQHL